jgi:hypothetical protein
VLQERKDNNMSSAVIQKMEELFSHPENLTPENMEGLIHETLKFLNNLREKIESPDEKVREAALREASDLKTKLEEQAARLCETVGMDPQALETYINTPAHFSPEEWQSMEKAKTELDGYQEEIAKTESVPAKSKRSSKKKPKSVKEWIVG